jgi:hypothetical protein
MKDLDDILRTDGGNSINGGYSAYNVNNLNTQTEFMRDQREKESALKE